MTYLTSRIAAIVIAAFVHVDALCAGLVQLETSRAHALEAAQSVDALSW